MGCEGDLYVVSGPSGVGKGTICRQLCRQRPEVRMSVSCTTRAARAGEIEGVHYFFVSNEKFDEMVAQDQFLEWAGVHGNRYGTPRAYVEQQLREGRSVILEIDVQGAAQAMRHYPGVRGVFMLPPSRDELLRRLIVRGSENVQQIFRRVSGVPGELRRAEDYEFLLLNDNREDALDRLERTLTGQYRTGVQENRLLSELEDQFAQHPADLDELTQLIEKYRR